MIVLSLPSEWPLSEGASRIILPASIQLELENNALSKGLFPSALGFYPHAYRHQMARPDPDDYLLMYCVGGKGELWVDGDSSRRVDTGDVIVLPPRIAHRYAALGNEPWSLYWVHMKGKRVGDYCASLGSSCLFKGLNDLALLTQFRSLVELAGGAYGYPAYQLLADSLRHLLSLIGYMIRKRADAHDILAVEKIATYMKANLSRRVTLDELAEISHLSKYYFNRKYKELTGYSPMQHFTHYKMEQACLQLEGARLSIAEIAFELGFEDPLYFSRVFKKFYGISPNLYRKQRGA